MEHHLITFSACVAIILLSLFSIMSKIMKPEDADSKVYTFAYYATLVVGLYFSMEFFKLIIYFNHLPFSM